MAETGTPEEWGAVPVAPPAPAVDGPEAWGAIPATPYPPQAPAPGPGYKPGVPSRPGKDAGLYAAFLSGFTSNDQEAVRMLADRLFPNEPLEKSLPRFSMDNGRVVYKGDDGELYDALPQSGLRNAGAKILHALPKSLPAVGGFGAGAVTAPLVLTGPGAAGTVAASVGGAAAGEVARQKLGDLLLGRASTGDIEWPEVAKQGIESGIGQAVGVGVNQLVTRHNVRDIAKFDPAKTAQAYDRAERVGVPITPAEATGLPSLAAQQKRLANIPATSDEMKQFIDARNQKVFDVWNGFLDNVSKAADAEEVGKLARGTAQNVIKGMRDNLQKEATPYYQAAFEKGDIPIWSPTLERLTGSPTVKSAMQGAVKVWQDNAIADGFGAMNPGAVVERGGILKFMNGELPAFPNLQFWDYTKRIIDNQIEAAINAGERSKARTLTRLVGQLRSELDVIGPSEYKTARGIWSTGSEEVTNALQSAMNIIAETKDTSILQAARHAFDPASRSPQMVAKLRNAIDGENPDAWQALKRLYLQDVTTDALRITEIGEVANPAGKIFKAFSNPRVAANMRVAMTPDEQDRFRELMAVFRRAASVPPTRSDTAWNQLINEAAESDARPIVAKVVRNINPATALNSLADWLTEKNLDKQASNVVQLVISGDKDAIAKMRELRQVSPGSKRGLLLLGHLISRGGGAAVENAVAEPNAAQE